MNPFLGVVRDHRDGGRRRGSFPPLLLLVVDDHLLLDVPIKPAVQDRECVLRSGLIPLQSPVASSLVKFVGFGL